MIDIRHGMAKTIVTCQGKVKVVLPITLLFQIPKGIRDFKMNLLLFIYTATARRCVNILNTSRMAFESCSHTIFFLSYITREIDFLFCMYHLRR